jgi:hypothetical protein
MLNTVMLLQQVGDQAVALLLREQIERLAHVEQMLAVLVADRAPMVTPTVTAGPGGEDVSPETGTGAPGAKITEKVRRTIRARVD